MTTTETPRVDNSKSHPYYVQRARLLSFHAQQIYDRGFDIAATSIFQLAVVLRAIGSNEQAQEVESTVDAAIAKVAENLKNESGRLDKLAEANGIEFSSAGVGYSKPMDVEARITSPRSIRFLSLIRDFDALVAKFDTLWLAGVISDSVMASTIYSWKRSILRVAGNIRNVTQRALRAARIREQQDRAASADKTKGSPTGSPDDIAAVAADIPETAAHAEDSPLLAA